MKLKDFDFRIWDKTKEAFLKQEPTLIKLDNERVIAGRISRFYANTADIADMFIGNGNDLELELWSGICDKNRFRIYEGDIIECKAKIAGLYKKVRGSVIFKDRHFYVLVNKDIYKLNTLSNIKLLGNIHENKELLNH
ncbi:YopX family protein [Campylobacter upsaliensis]|uniref:YopX family protein n=1 Tax=Campylobacter upsaliensis TaxID=28080 RepID=UPI00214A45C5|nr:YopX family protein [Campylobacter upsaliensis]MCR2099403.1 YopX family protein [Campylobacter upsaliensis]